MQGGVLSWVESWHITPSLFCGLNIFFIDWSIGSVQYFRSYLQVYTYITTGVLYSIGKKSQMELSSADLKSTSDLNLLAMCLILQSLLNSVCHQHTNNAKSLFNLCDVWLRKASRLQKLQKFSYGLHIIYANKRKKKECSKNQMTTQFIIFSHMVSLRIFLPYWKEHFSTYEVHYIKWLTGLTPWCLTTHNRCILLLSHSDNKHSKQMTFPCEAQCKVDHK